jgi:hypothetical protein
MDADVDEPTGVVVTVKVAVVLPAETSREAGVVAAGLLLDKVTSAPPEGAGELSVTVAMELLPPVTVVGLKLSELSIGGVTDSVAVCEVPP